MCPRSLTRVKKRKIARRKVTLQHPNKAAINWYRFQERALQQWRIATAVIAFSFLPRGNATFQEHLKIARLEMRGETSASSSLMTRKCLPRCFRISAPFQVVAAVLIFAATVSALIGHCYSDHRTLVACGLFLLSGKYRSSNFFNLQIYFRIFYA